MKKTLSILALLLVVALFAGCSLLPTVKPVQKQEQPAGNVFDYNGTYYAQDDILVRIVKGTDVEKLAKAYKSEVVNYWPEIGWATFTVPAGSDVQSFIKQLKHEGKVMLAEPNMEYKLDDASFTEPTGPGYKEQWGFINTKIVDAWKATTGHDKVIVAILDTGVQTDHPEFADKTILTPYDAAKQIEGPIVDGDGHGTHVAGIAADDGQGMIAGVAWKSPILPIKCRNDQLSGSGIRTSFLIEAMIYLGEYREAHPDYQIVANMSIGGRGYNFAFKDAIDFAADRGVLLVTSAGNDGRRIIQFPSGYNGVVSVAASDQFDRATSFSTRAWFNSLAAPGIDILSTYTGSNYAYLQGTSMAAPFVTGTAALVLAAHFNENLTPLQLKNQLEQTARNVGAPVEEVGAGIVDPVAAVGPLKPMVYGSLNVTSNIVSNANTGYVGGGVVTVFDSNNKLVAFGLTGENGNYNVRAIRPGAYTVNISYYCAFTESYEVKSKNATVVADQGIAVDFDIQVPTHIDKTPLLTHQVLKDDEEVALAVGIKIEEAGIYEFVTSPNTDPDFDTTIMILDKDSKVVAYNDDGQSNGPFSSLMKILQPGNYTVVVADFELANPIDAVLDISKLTVTF